MWKDRTKYDRENDETIGESLDQDIEIDFLESVKGVVKEILLTKKVVCPDCNGSRAKKGISAKKCNDCAGRGLILDHIGTKKICSTCSGAGFFINHPCDTCTGMGSINKQVKDTIEIPAGVGHEQKVRYINKGHAS